MPSLNSAPTYLTLTVVPAFASAPLPSLRSSIDELGRRLAALGTSIVGFSPGLPVTFTPDSPSVGAAGASVGASVGGLGRRLGRLLGGRRAGLAGAIVLAAARGEREHDEQHGQDQEGYRRIAVGEGSASARRSDELAGGAAAGGRRALGRGHGGTARAEAVARLHRRQAARALIARAGTSPWPAPSACTQGTAYTPWASPPRRGAGAERYRFVRCWYRTVSDRCRRCGRPRRRGPA